MTADPSDPNGSDPKNSNPPAAPPSSGSGSMGGSGDDDGTAGIDVGSAVLTVRPMEDAKTGGPIVPAAEASPTTLFIFPLKRAVPFPGLMMPVLAEGSRSKEIVEKAQAQGAYLGLLLQRDPEEEAFAAKAFYEVGVLARIHKTIALPNGNMTVICGGMKRFRVERFARTSPYPIAKVTYPPEMNPGGPEVAAIARNIPNLVKSITSKDSAFGEELSMAALNIDNPGMLADFAAAYFIRDPGEKQQVLESFQVLERLRLVHEWLTRDNEMLSLGKRLQDEIKEKIERQQKQFFLREQLKLIRRELGEEKDRESRDREEYEKKIAEAKMPEAALTKAMEELNRLSVVPVESSEYAVVRNYLDWLCAMPWSKSAEEQLDPDRAEKILHEDHYGLDEVKDRIVEYIGVRKLRPDKPGPILCLVGPPGVGKTSLGRSIARATNRPFVRTALGGVRDEAEIRGHRRTYVGALPGRIIQELKNAKVNNPVFLLDEIDKLGSDFRGDPSSALLEVLDPQQNSTFRDHYLDVAVDLSRVLFLTTANYLDSVPGPLRDRLEILEIPGYVTEEKVAIARKYIVPRQVEAHGLTRKDLELPPSTVRAIIEGYTREAGVRTLEKRIEKLARRRALAKARRRKGTLWDAFVKPDELAPLLGPPKFLEDMDRSPKKPGVAVGLAWTPVGGDVLSIEAARWRGKGAFHLTGQLGDVMNESARIAVAYLRANAQMYGLNAEDFDQYDLHVHFPAGATPKDGPSAGITIATAVLSLFRNELMTRGLAMTGELTLTGDVLPIGGVREKVLVAKRFGIRRVVLPELNRADVKELRPHLVKGMKFEYVKSFPDVAKLVLASLRRLPAAPAKDPAGERERTA
ncbi:MAG: endopeptidase La [Planctomycetes bacterium]|nr:endopeptidase La [Planctomycetota bacterium]